MCQMNAQSHMNPLVASKVLYNLSKCQKWSQKVKSFQDVTRGGQYNYKKHNGYAKITRGNVGEKMSSHIDLSISRRGNHL